MHTRRLRTHDPRGSTGHATCIDPVLLCSEIVVAQEVPFSCSQTAYDYRGGPPLRSFTIKKEARVKTAKTVSQIRCLFRETCVLGGPA